MIPLIESFIIGGALTIGVFSAITEHYQITLMSLIFMLALQIGKKLHHEKNHQKHKNQR